MERISLLEDSPYFFTLMTVTHERENIFNLLYLVEFLSPVQTFSALLQQKFSGFSSRGLYFQR